MITIRSVHACIGAGGLALLSSCSPTAVDPVAVPATVKALSQATVPPPQGRGFVHNASHSRFRIGSSPVSREEFGMSKVVGSDGTFGTVTQTGWVLAIPNAGAPSTLVAALTQDPDAHNKTVLDYFVGAGLPADQVGAPQALARVRGEGNGPGANAQVELDGYTTVLTRVVAGFSVPDSFAWARFNADGDVIEEQVYWPTIPDSAVADAKALAAVMSDRGRSGAFSAALPAGTRTGQVVIHHASGVPGHAFEVAASYDAMDSGQMASLHHFDIHGVEFRLASETEPAPMPPSVKR
jgi:hypothetical protein